MTGGNHAVLLYTAADDDPLDSPARRGWRPITTGFPGTWTRAMSGIGGHKRRDGGTGLSR